MLQGARSETGGLLPFMALCLAFVPVQICAATAVIDLASIRLPVGFSISVFSADVPGARSLALADDGTVFVGTQAEGKVYALRDTNQDGKADQVMTVASGLDEPNGVAWSEGQLYIGEISRISRLDWGKAQSASPQALPATPQVILDQLPHDRHHGWKYLRVGPDRRLYSAVGAPCNVCRPAGELYGTLIRFDRDGQHLEIFARGVRNSVGFDWHPLTRELWFTDNGRDGLGDDRPPDELNHAPAAGLHFGFPYCFGKDVSDPEFGHQQPCTALTPAAWAFPAHVAAIGMRFYTGTQFPESYRNQLLVAQHGSWDRSTPQGYRVSLVRFKDGQPVSEEPFAAGWLRPDGKVTGRPVDVLVMPDGAVLVSDNLAGAVYRITYKATPHQPPLESQ